MVEAKVYVKDRSKRKKLNVKKIVLVSLGVLFGIVIIWCVGLWIYCRVSLATYHNEKDGFELSYPKTWTVKERPMKDVVVAFISPKENALDTFWENVNLSTYDMSKLPHSVDDYARIMIEQLVMIFSDVQLVEKTLFPVAGQKGYRMVLNITGADPKVIVVYAFTINTMGYNLLYVGTPERYLKDRILLDAMALSLKVRYLEP
jgi:hypothetical protein